MNNHEIDYKLYGDDMQFVEVELDPDETVVAEAGSLMMMDDQIRMETIFGDGSSKHSGGLMDKFIGAGKRLITGESLFMTAFTNEGMGKKTRFLCFTLPGKNHSNGFKSTRWKIDLPKGCLFSCCKRGIRRN